MFHSIQSSTFAWTMALAVAAASPAWAQAPGATSVPAAVHAPIAAPTPSLVPAYQSTFDGYRGFSDQRVDGWAAANQAAADIGGWRAYARAARAPASAGGGAAPTTHAGHDMHTPGSSSHARSPSGAHP